MSNLFDVIIVGAGPAGSTAALRTARKGYKTLLIDKGVFPRDKSCGDGLTRTTTKLLHELGLLEKFTDFQKINGVNIYVDNEGSRSFQYPDDLQHPNYGMVVPRSYLDNILYQEAVKNGALFLGNATFDKLLYNKDNKKVIGIQLNDGSKYFSDLVIGADGAASKIAYQSQLASTPKNKLGFGLRGYFKNIEELNEKLEIYLPILDSTNKKILPSYGWVFPINKYEANIGVGLMEKKSSDNIQMVMDRFVEKLKMTDERFKNIELQGRYFGAPMRFDFNPEKTFAPGLLLVGDAAGLISPFTGEGIGYAIETGIIASDFYMEIKQSKKQFFLELSGYGKILASKYQGYFEAGINSVNRYHLVWKTLKGTFQNDKPLFSAIRQATIFPEGIGESFFDYFTEDVSHQIKGFNAELRTDVISISENLINITRKDWPFLSKLFTAHQVTPGIPFRPALFLLLSGYTYHSNRDDLIKLGTAIELGFAASLCHNSIIEECKNNSSDSTNWGNMLSILIGDFLLSKSFEIIAGLESSYTRTISESLSNSNKGVILLKDKMDNDIENLTLDEYIEACYLKNCNTFELCMVIGSSPQMSKNSKNKSLKEFGKHFGTGYFIIQDLIYFMKKTSEVSNFSTPNLFSENEELSLISFITKKYPDQALDIATCKEVAKKEINKALFYAENLEDFQLKKSLINISKLLIQKMKNEI